jgi:solute carrier family 25 carnitine/acylcarnitine transporter 20/29
MYSDIISFVAGSIAGISEVLTGHPLDTVKTRIQNNKPLPSLSNLYNGCRYPLIANSIVISLEFGVFQSARNHGYSITTSGIFAGIATSFVMAPVDRFKIKRQMSYITNIYTNPFKGLQYVLAREVPATAIYFNSYYYYKEKTPIMIAGGLAGMTTWSIVYPLDVIKTRMQSDLYETLNDAFIIKGIYKGIVPCLIRSVFVNSVSFYTYECIINLLNN